MIVYIQRAGRLVVNLGGTAEANKLLSLFRDESFFYLFAKLSCKKVNKVLVSFETQKN